MTKQGRRDIDVLWLFEHVARECDVACVVSSQLRARGVSVEVRNMYQHARAALGAFSPKVVVHPFFYFGEGAIATEDFIRAWPDAVHFNLAWEQIHYGAHEKIKAPSDAFARQRVIHHAWGGFYRDFLIKNGVPSEHIFVNGNPACQLYREPYKGAFPGRAELCVQHGLSPLKRWVFIPENYRWAFIGKKTNLLQALGGDLREMEALGIFCRRSLKQLIQWCEGLDGVSSVEIIFRPRPATPVAVMDGFIRDVSSSMPSAFHVIKDGSVREWVMASDIVVSSYSTTLIEGALAGKPVYMAEPIPMPQSLLCEWHEHTPRIGNAGEFASIVQAPVLETSLPLQEWAEKRLLGANDALLGLVDYCDTLVRQKSLYPNSHELVDLKAEEEYFNPLTHDMDAINESELECRIARWGKVLGGTQTGVSEPINRTMERTDLDIGIPLRVTGELNDLVRQLSVMGMAASSWVGTVSEPEQRSLMSSLFSGLGRKGAGTEELSDMVALRRGEAQRLHYLPLDGAVDDLRYPWFLYWEIAWVISGLLPYLRSGMRVLDAGGTASLCSCYLASCGVEVDSVDLNPKLVPVAQRISDAMNWKMRSHVMDLRSLCFPDASFDHAVSICVFEHLDQDIKQAALSEMARCVKPGGMLSLTFDYRNPAPGVKGRGKDASLRNRLSTPEDVCRAFMSNPHFEPVGNSDFIDTGSSYLLHPEFPGQEYTFGALMLRRR